MKNISGDCVLHLADCRDLLPDLPRTAAVITDPPYGMKWDTNSTRFTGGHRSSIARRGIGRADWGVVVGDNEPFDPTPWLTFQDVILWGANHYAQRLPVGTTLVWLKRKDPAFASFLSDAEIAWKKGGHGVYCRRDTTMYAIGRRRVHPTQKPLAIMAWCIERLRNPPLIIDPYLGSGTTGIAATNAGCKFIGVEIDPKYFDIACRRIEQVMADQTKRETWTDMWSRPYVAPPRRWQRPILSAADRARLSVAAE